MIELLEQYKEEGFFLVSPIYYKGRTFLKCGNKKNNNIYYFELKSKGFLEEIKEEEILNWLIENYSYKMDNNVYRGRKNEE